MYVIRISPECGQQVASALPSFEEVTTLWGRGNWVNGDWGLFPVDPHWSYPSSFPRSALDPGLEHVNMVGPLAQLEEMRSVVHIYNMGGDIPKWQLAVLIMRSINSSVSGPRLPSLYPHYPHYPHYIWTG